MGMTDGAQHTDVVVNLGQKKTRCSSSGTVILLAGSVSKIRDRITFSSGEMGKIDRRKAGSFRKAR